MIRHTKLEIFILEVISRDEITRLCANYQDKIVSLPNELYPHYSTKRKNPEDWKDSNRPTCPQDSRKHILFYPRYDWLL